MSQDIRSFFTRTPKEKSNGKEKSSESGPENKKRSRKIIVLDSDSDDEPITKVSKTEISPKGSKSQNKTKCKQESPKTSKYFEVPRTSVADLLGKAPVKRIPQPGIKAKKEAVDEFGSDDDFSAAFQQLEDDEDWFVNDGKKEEKKKPQNKEKDETTTSLQEQKSSPEKSKSKIEEASSKKLESSPVKQLANRRWNSSPNKSSDHSLSPEKVPAASPSPKKPRLDDSDRNEKDAVPRKPESQRRTKIETDGPGLVSSPQSSSKSLLGQPEKVPEGKFELWVEKYKPTSLKQIIGQQGEKSNVNKLLRWLRNWNKNHSGDKKLSKPSPWAKDDSGAYFKAALLSGSPGVGKTTTTHLVCRELNMDMVEFNASDTRSKRMLSDQVSELLSTKSLSQYVHGGGEVSRKHVLVMDEVDGMAGNEDRGGVQELINLIKSSKVPIICMCNDRNHPKIRSLVNYCFDLRFSKPRVDQIRGAMMSICFKEKLKLKPETLNEIITTTNQDIRLVLNHLSMLAAKDSNLDASRKNIKLGPWDVLKKVFSEEDHKNMSLYDKSDLFFHDYSVAPLFVHENYLLVVPHSPQASTKLGKIELFSKAASSLCIGDMMESAIRSNNSWSLLPVQAMFSSVIPGEVLEGHMGGQISFPAWFGKNSRRGKLDRLSQELQVHTRLRTSCNKEAMRLDYCKVLRDELAEPLVTEGSDGVAKALDFLHSYNLLREDVESLMELNAWPGSHDPFQSVDSKVKAAFTRAYNKNPVLTPFSITAPIKKGRGGAATEEYEEEEGEEEIETQEDDMSTDAMIVVKKKQEKKSEKKSETKGNNKSVSGTSKSKARKGKK